MALPPAVNAYFTQLVTHADIAPLATRADIEIAIAPLATQAQLAAMQAQTQAQFAAMQAHIIAQIQVLLVPHNAPAIATAVSATIQAISASRAQNAHDRSGEAYAVVLRFDGTQPPNWPVGFDREALSRGTIIDVDALLNDFGLPNGPPLAPHLRRNTLAQHIGTMRL